MAIKKKNKEKLSDLLSKIDDMICDCEELAEGNETVYDLIREARMATQDAMTELTL